MKKSHIIISIILVLAIISACVPEPTPAPVSPTSDAAEEIPPTSGTLTDWWEDVVFYEIFVRSFYDSDNDGIGDFNGITEKLDYLEDLGINAIWLMPIHPSPSYHGYDVINYYAVNHEYGTMKDFKNLLEEAHKRDIRIVIDLVLNHTSSQHPFFVDANANPDSSYRDWYIWENEHPGWGGGQWHEGNQGYYFGLFWGGMPDLNYRNPEVAVQMEKVVRYWVDEIGVDGFRLDAVKHLIEEGTTTENTPATHEWLVDFYPNYKIGNDDIYTVGEVWGADSTIALSYVGQMDHVFNFELAGGFRNSANGGSNTGINSAYNFTLEKIPNGEYATFLGNHDSDRMMSVFYGNVGKAKVAASMLLTAPGTPFIYYGEEIGMRGQKPDEDIRLPMQWSDGAYYCFSGTQPWRTGDAGGESAVVAVQEGDPDSLLSHYKNLISLRHEYAALRTGRTEVLDLGTTALYAVLRTQGDEEILVIANLTEELVSDYQLEIDREAQQLFGPDFDFTVPIPAYETLIFSLK